MAIPEWFFGPAGDLRPLPSPEMNVVDTVERFGGVHTSITGSRTVDVLGHKSRYEFEMKYLDEAEYFRLEELYATRQVGDLYLVNPLRRNLFSRESACSQPAITPTSEGLRANQGMLTWSRITDGPTPYTRQVGTWSSLSDDATIGIDPGLFVPLRSGEGLVVSAYIRPTQTRVMGWVVNPYTYDDAETPFNTETTSCPANTWTRLTTSITPVELDGFTGVVINLRNVSGGDSSGTIQIASPQLEVGSSVTDWTPGEGYNKVLIGDMSTTSPYFPLRNVNLTLLEV